MYTTGDPYCTHNIVLYFYPIFIIIVITYSMLFNDLFFCITHLFIILLLPYNSFSFFVSIVLFIVLYFMYTYGLFVRNKHTTTTKTMSFR